MKLKHLGKVLGAEPVWVPGGSDWGERDVGSCHASDLISDLLTFRAPGPLLLTGLTNSQVIRTAEILEFVAVCFVRGKMPLPEAVALGEEKGIPLFVTPLSMFESSGRLYAKGVQAGGKRDVEADCQTEK